MTQSPDPLSSRLPGRAVLLGLICARLLAPATAAAEVQAMLPGELQGKLDQTIRKILADTNVPSASVAIAKGGRLVYVQAYGDAHLAPRQRARPALRYHIGSVSKQFTATAMLQLVEQGALSLDDPVSRFLPNLTRAREVTIRQLLSHTSGYQDYWPQDYVPAFMRRDVTPDDILNRWARKALDFDPGTRWQYSNTNFIIAGLIIEKASGMPFWRYLRTKVLEPIGLKDVVSLEQPAPSPSPPGAASAKQPVAAEATGYERHALGPPRVAAREGHGWLFATGELSMTAEELGRWDLALLGRRLLKPASHALLTSTVLLKNGLGTEYGLGIGVKSESERRVLSHGGEVAGFCSMNLIFPDDDAAIAVLVNQDRTAAAAQIAKKIMALLFDTEDGGAATKAERARQIFEKLQQGKIDRALFTENGNGYFTEEVVADFAQGLRPLGKPVEFAQTAQRARGGMILRRFKIKLPHRTLTAWTRELPDGRIEEYQVAPEE